MNLRDWEHIYCHMIIPRARAAVIRSQYPSLNEQQTQAAFYYVNCNCNASWSDLAKKLSWWRECCGEEAAAAIETFKSQLPKPQGEC